MKVFHVISGGDDGGAKIHLINLCMGSQGVFDNVVGCINEGPLYDMAKENGIETRIFKQKSRFDMRIAKEIAEFVKNNDIDIINFHGANANLVYLFLRKQVSIPCVTTLHSDYRYDFINNKVKYMIFTPINAYSLRRFKNYLCVSSRIKKLIDQKGFKGSKFIVNNGVDINFKIVENRDEIRKRYNISYNDFVYIMVARFHPIKNHMSLIKAFSKLREQNDNVKLMLVGNGENMGEIKEEVCKLGLKDSVIFAGRQEKPMDFINASDVNILTSFNETFPLVILEGGLVNKMAICTDVGDIKDIINDTTGYLIDAYCVEDIYEKMLEAYELREDIQAKGEKLGNIVKGKYSLRDFSMKYFNSYNEILKGGRDG